MPISFRATREELGYHSYMVEAVYRQEDTGVWLAMTTAASNRARGAPHLWDVFLLPGVEIVDVLLYRYLPDGVLPHRAGSFGEVCPLSFQYPTMEAYCRRHFQNQWYRHWVGYSMEYHDLDRRYHALDVYYQTPRMMYGPMWIWYVMMDRNEPNEYWQGRALWFNGKRDLGMDVRRIAKL